MKTGITVHDCMTTKPVAISEAATLQQAAQLMAHYRVGALLVKHLETATGIISDQDIVRHFVAKGINPLNKKVKDYKAKELITIAPDADIYDALVKMRDHGIRHLPVLEDGKLVGLLTQKDILKVEPQLFDILVEKFELVEEDRKMRAIERLSNGDETAEESFFGKIMPKLPKRLFPKLMRR
jgi:CBS domain-containing protein